MTDWIIEGGRTLVGEELKDQSLYISDGRIVADPPSGAHRFDARFGDTSSGNSQSMLVLPGLVDIHGDAFERQILPRPKVAFPLDVALRETDQQMIANGITTAYHGLTVSWEPGLRSLEAAHGFVEALTRLRPQLACDTRLHVRWETFALEAMDPVLTWLRSEFGAILAFNDHTTAMVRKERGFSKLQRTADRAGMTVEAYEDLIKSVWQRRDEVPAVIATMAQQGRDAGAVLLAHDEYSPEIRRYYRDLGAKASEFPTTEETALDARQAGEHVILGAPNVVRGGSHQGTMGAAWAVSKGLCSVLASDYYYPAMLLAVFRLVAEERADLPQAWALVSQNPAEAAGLDDRGSLHSGKRADVIVVDDRDPALPKVRACFVAGQKVYEAA